MKRLLVFVLVSAWLTTALAPCSEVLAKGVKRGAKSSKNRRKPPKYRKKYSRGKPGKLTKDQKKRKKERDKKSKTTSMGRLMGAKPKVSAKKKKPKKKKN